LLPDPGDPHARASVLGPQRASAFSRGAGPFLAYELAFVLGRFAPVSAGPGQYGGFRKQTPSRRGGFDDYGSKLSSAVGAHREFRAPKSESEIDHAIRPARGI
jgi:hypothetical protein